MKCPKCQTDNPDTQKFCGECAAPLTAAGEGEPAFTKTLETPLEFLKRGTLFAARYEIIEELGRGGMGAVYRVEDTKAREEIAIKLIKPEIAADKNALERFRNELTSARKIAHRNVCRMFDLGEGEGTHYISMEYVPGEDLKSFIRRSKRLSIPSAVSIAKQICEGLAEAHKLGIVHRDLKPANIMIDKQGNVRIMDFGIARSLKSKSITSAGYIIGTPEYMSPEQVEAKEIDQRSDLYSVGIILYEMVTGQVPFAGDTPFAVGMKHKGEFPRNPQELNAQIPDVLKNVILTCLAKEKEERFHSAEDLLLALDDVEKEIPDSGRTKAKDRAPTSQEITVTIGLKKFLLPGLVIAAIAVIAIVAWQFIPMGEPNPSPSQKTSVAILPFDDLSPQKDQEYFCDGLAETLITALSKINSLYVPAKPSAFSFKNREKNYQEIGEKLNVETILDGSIQKSGEQVRINARLIDIANETVIWSEQFESSIQDMFKIQDEISLAVVDRLKVAVPAQEKADLSQRYTENVEAYQLYLQGEYYRYNETARNYFRAKDCYEQAAALDPNFALAYAGLAQINLIFGMQGYVPREEGEEAAKRFAQKALSLAPNSAKAHTSVGVNSEVFDWDWAEAEKRFLHAIDLNPNDYGAHWEHGLLLMRTNRLEAAEEALIRALELNPLSTLVLSRLVMVYRGKGLPDKAQELIARMNELGIPKFSVEDTVETITKRIEDVGRRPYLLGRLGMCYVESGNIPEAEKLISELKGIYERENYANTATSIAWILSSMGKLDKSFEWLDRAVARREPSLIESLHVPWFAALKDDPRYPAFLKQIGLIQ